MSERHLARELIAAQCWACCRHETPYPMALARRRRCPLGADRPRRSGPPGGARAGRRRHRGWGAPGQLLWPRGRPRAGPRAGRCRARRRQRPRFRHRRLRSPRRPRRRDHCRRARLRGRHRLPGRAPLALAPDLRARPRHLRASSWGDALALDLPRSQPDHGGAGGDDGRGRGGRALGLADHRRPRRRPGPRPRRRARPGQLALLGRPEQPAGGRRLPGPRRAGRARRDAGPGRGAIERAGPGARCRSARDPRSGRAWRGHLRRGRVRPRSLRRRGRSALARLELLGYVSCSLVGTYSRTLLQSPAGI